MDISIIEGIAEFRISVKSPKISVKRAASRRKKKIQHKKNRRQPLTVLQNRKSAFYPPNMVQNILGLMKENLVKISVVIREREVKIRN